MSREFLMPPKIVTGKNAIEDAMKYIVQMGKKPLIVTGRVVATLEAFSLFFSEIL